MTIEFVYQDIFVTGAKFICHQTNCASINAADLAREIFHRYPYSNCYKDRDSADYDEFSKCGTIQICGDGLKERYIINMFSQHYPGKAVIDPAGYDSTSDRKRWFYNCLMEISKISDLHSIAFPDHVGCGLAGGDWDWYFKTINKFSTYIERKAKVIIYKQNA